MLSGWKNCITRRNLMLRMVVLFKGLRLTELGDVTSPNSGGMMIGSAGLVVSSADPFPNGLRHGKFIVFVHAGRVQTTRFRTSGTACSSHVLSDWQCVRPLLICRQGRVGRLTNISPIIVQLRISVFLASEPQVQHPLGGSLTPPNSLDA